MVKIKIPRWKLSLIKKLTIWPRATIYLLVYLFLSFVYYLNTAVDADWNAHVLGRINWLFSNSKGIVRIGLFLLVKTIIYLAYFLLLEYLFNKLSRLDISSKEFLQIVTNKKISLNKQICKVRKVVLLKQLYRKKVLGLLVYEGDFANNFEVGFSFDEVIPLDLVLVPALLL